MGKTLCACEIIRSAVDRGKRALFLVPRRQLAWQSSEKLDLFGVSHGIIMSGERPSLMPDVQVASVQTIYRRCFEDGEPVQSSLGGSGMPLPPADVLVIDECFPAGTEVDTPRGKVPIEDIRSGDMVITAFGPFPVAAMSRRLTKTTYEVRMSDGSKIRCTGNHPIFTDRGWVEASNLDVGSRVFRKEDVSSLRGHDDPDLRKRESGARSPVASSPDLLSILRQEAEQSVIQRGDTEKGFGNTEKDRPQAGATGREWKGADGTSAKVMESVGSGVGDGACPEYMDGRAGRHSAESLQNRHSRPTEKDCNRSGWRDSSFVSREGVRQEEGCALGGIRVDGVSRIEQGSDEVVYNLSVRGHPSYFANGVLVHNCHANCSNMAQKIIAQYPNAIRIGMTATPIRSDSKGLGHIYDDIVQGPSVRWAMDNGYLCELRYFGPSEWDLSGVQMQAGDYNQKQLGKAVNKPKLVGDVVRNWERIAPDRTTVVFAVDRKHARALHEAFTNAGHAAEYIDGQTENDERNEIFRRLENGESRVLCSVAVVDMGWDAPWAECAVLARPTKSLARYLQAVGRILRPAPGKQDAILIDHTGAVQNLGFVDDDFEWTLDGVEKKEKSKDKQEAKEQTTVTCPGCHAVIKPAPACPECGHEMKAESKRAIEAKEAELQEIYRKKRKSKSREWTLDEKAAFAAELKGYAHERGFKEGWAVHAYKDRMGVLPWPVWDTPPKTPSAETRSWITSRNIRNAKRKEKAQRESA